MDNPSSPAPPPAQPAQPPPWAPDEPQGPGFLRSIQDAKATWAFIATAVVIYLMCWNEMGRGSFLLQIPEHIATKYGAYSWQRVRDDGEWWRVVTTLFVSRIGLDAVIYLVIFGQLGPQLERLLGTPRFCALYLAAGAGGVALAELTDPTSRLSGDTIVAVYAGLGAIPGVILGVTGSVAATIKNAEARSAVFWIGFWTLVRYGMTQRVEPSIVGAALLGMALGAGLTLSKRKLAAGIAMSAVPLLVTAALIGLVAQGKRWRDGKLVDRGRPASGRVPPGTTTEPQPLPDDPGEQPRTSFLDPPEASDEKVQALREKTKPFLDRFGPLPARDGYSAVDREQAARLLAEVERVATGTNLVMGELDVERVKLNIINYNMNAASRIAGEHHALTRTPYAQALAGLAAYYQSSLERAEDHLEAVTRDEPFTVEVPEALYYYASVLEERHGLEVAAAHYERYLRLVQGAPAPPWRADLVAKARGKLGR